MNQWPLCTRMEYMDDHTNASEFYTVAVYMGLFSFANASSSGFAGSA
jgi:hypothetical protein